MFVQFTEKTSRFLQRLICVGLLFSVVDIDAACNVCQGNQVACINSTSFYLCFGESTPNKAKLYHCMDGFDCTDLDAICVQKSSQRQPSCGDTSQCGLCSAQRNYLFACLSRSIFQMCYGANRPSGQLGYCPTGYICDATSDNVCVPDLIGASVTCDISDQLVDTTTTTTTTQRSTQPSTIANTTESTTTTTPTSMTPTEVCESVRQVGLFPTMPNDPYCKRYIYCSYSQGIIKAHEYTCASGSYYSIEGEVCTIIKPSYCI